MKYAFNTWAYSSYPTWLPAYTLDDTIRRIASIGYDGIEIGCAAPHAFPAHLSTNRRRELRALLGDTGLTAVSMLPAPGGGPGNNPASPLREERAAAIEHYREVIDLAADLGATKVLYIPGWIIYGVRYQQALDWSAKALGTLALHAADRGIMLVVEPTPYDSNLVETVDDALRLAATVEGNNIGVMVDTSHAYYRQEPCEDVIRQYGAHLVHMHAADRDRLPPGKGTIDWQGVMQALTDINFEGYITLEVGFNSRSTEPDGFARSGLNFLKGLEKEIMQR